MGTLPMADQLHLFDSAQPDGAPAIASPPEATPTRAPLPAAPDQPHRDLVTGGLDLTLFVEAGAGSGKTTALVQRVVNLILAGVPVGSIAAITFTEKAAAELRHKIRRSLEAAGAGAGAGAAMVDAALADLDQAPIGTLHAFARRLLSEFPVEAQLPPQFGVLDEVQSATAFHERFTDFLETLLDDPQSVRLVELCQYDNFGVEKGVRLMAEDFQANWDLVDERVSAVAPPPVMKARSASNSPGCAPRLRRSERPRATRKRSSASSSAAGLMRSAGCCRSASCCAWSPSWRR